MAAVYGCSSAGSTFGSGGATGSSSGGAIGSGSGGATSSGSGGAIGSGSGGNVDVTGSGGRNDTGSGGASGETGTGTGGTPGTGSGGSTAGSGGRAASTGGSGTGTGGATTGTGGATADCKKPAGQICHEFIANDNGRNQSNYVNEFDPSKNWTTKVGDSGESSPRAIQIVDNMMAKSGKAVLISTNTGYSELDLVDGKSLKKVTVGSGVTWALRLPDGNTAVAKDPSIIIYGPTGAATGKTITLPSGPADTVRAINYNPANSHYFFSKGERPGHVYEITDTGATVWDTSLGTNSKGYVQFPREGGGVFATTGYLGSVVEIDVAKTIKTVVDGKKFTEYKVDFFSGFVRLPNGNFMVASWLGHVGKPDPNTPQALEFSADGTKVVWTWGIQSQAALVTNVYVIR